MRFGNDRRPHGVPWALLTAHILGAEMGRLQAVQVTDGSLESGHVGTHAAMSTRSATVMGLDATRASIAGEDTTRRPRSLDESANFR